MSLYDTLAKPKKLSYPLKKSNDGSGEIHFLEESETLIDTDGAYPFLKYNPVQSTFYPHRLKNANFVICAATSAGKTIIAELSKQNTGKFLYLSPLKAITEEKRISWTQERHAWNDLKVTILTGDYTLNEEKVHELRQSDVIALTSEMLDSRSRRINIEKNDWLLEVTTLVIDEFHLLGFSSRGDKLETAIIRFLNQNPNCRIIALSATMANVEEVAKWFTKLNNKNTYIINSDYRPVKLELEYLPYTEAGYYAGDQEIIIDRTIGLLFKYPQDKVIIFVHTKNTGRQLITKLKSAGINSIFHSADLALDKRLEIESSFRSKGAKSLRVLVSTSTLAWGVNTPADVVIVTGVYRGLSRVDPMEIKQMIGRAGRIGLAKNPIGRAFVFLPSKNFSELQDYYNNNRPIKSQMETLPVFCFHICAEVMSGKVEDVQSLLTWYGNSFSYIQGRELDIDTARNILEKLTELKMLKKDLEDKYQITGLGKVSAYMYYSPFDISDLYKNFSVLKHNNLPLDDLTFSWAMARIDSNLNGYAINDPDVLSQISGFSQKLSNYSLHCGTTSASLQAMAWYSLLTKAYSNLPLVNISKRVLKKDSERILTAVTLIDRMYAKWNLGEIFEDLALRIKYEIPEHLVGLVKLPGIGAIRADKLYKHNITSLTDIKKRQKVASMLVGESIIKKLISVADSKRVE